MSLRARLFAAGLFILPACQAADVPEELLHVERGALVLDVDVSGTLESVASLSVGPPAISGMWDYTIAMMAEEGKEVAEGDPILMFDTSKLQQQLEAKTAVRDSAAAQLLVKRSAAKIAREDEALALAEAKAALNKAKLKADVPPELMSEIELDQFVLDVDLAHKKVAHLEATAKAATERDQTDIGRWKSKHDRAEERVQEIGHSMEMMTVPAPRAGTVIHHSDRRGEKMKVGDSAWQGATILEIVSLAEMEGRGEIDEVDVSKVALEQVVSLRLDAQSEVELRGTVTEISPTVQRASQDNPLKVATVRIAIEDNADVKLRPGMRYRGNIETDRVEDVLLVPLAALEHTEDGPVAHVVRNGQVEQVVVTLGRRNDTYTVVLEGLEEDDAVVPIAEVKR